MTRAPVEARMRGEAAYLRIKEEIRSGHLPPGSRVREVDLAERLGISRTPVREALRRLEADGLVTHLPHVGAVIARLDQQATIELYNMREVLEGTAARYAATHASEAEVKDLGDILAIEREHVADPAASAQLNRAFHSALYQAAHNRFLLKSLESLADSVLLLGTTTLSLQARSESALEEHRAVVEAIAARDADAAEAAAREHIRNAQRARLKLLRLAQAQAPG